MFADLISKVRNDISTSKDHLRVIVILGLLGLMILHSRVER